MLLFELFPAFLMIVSLGVGLWLYAMNRRAREEDNSTNRDDK